MPQYIAFLRGINVGGHRVKMDRLGGLFEELGLDDVATFIASGNVIFSTESSDVESLTDQIERHLAQSLGYEVATFLRSPAQLEAMAAFESDTSVYVTLLRAPASDELRAVFACLSSEFDQFVFSGCEIYWQVQGKVSESPLFGKALEKATRGVPNTMRNLNTVRRLAEKVRRE